MTNNTLCLAPEIKLPSFELFVDFLVRKNNNVTKRPLLSEKGNETQIHIKLVKMSIQSKEFGNVCIRNIWKLAL